MKKQVFKYRYFHSFNGKVEERFGNSLNEANNASYNCAMHYYIINADGTETRVKPSHLILNNLIDGGFHNASIRKNK